MNFKYYKVVLTNGTTQQEYFKRAIGSKAAVILSQADAINMARGYEFVSVEEVERREALK